MTIDYRVLGPIEVWADGQQIDIGGARQRRLIAALVLADGRVVSAERLIDIVWVGEPPEQARNTLRTYVARARRALEVDGEAPLHTDANGWRLERPPDALDSARFENLLGAARAMAADPIAALASVEEALSLWRGDAFSEFADEDWCAGEAVRLDELRLVAEEERFEAMLGCGLYDDVIGELERFTEQHPLRDRSRGQQMLALYRAGRQVEAVRLFQGYRRYLNDEVGVEASEELRSLEQRIIRRDPSLRELAPVGRQLRGYQLGRQIGAGAFGHIYRASQPALGREVAIKVVRPELADDPEFIRRFDVEAQTIAGLEHPHIVPLFDYWREPGGAYLVMRYLKGGTAAQLLASHGPLSLSRVTRIVDEIGGALAAAHAQRVVHRDVKPANILFDEHGGSYLADFGIATGIGATRAPQSVAAASAVYLSPEQWSHGDVAPSADIYAFGVVVYELLTGEPPFPRQGSSADPAERSLPSVSQQRPDVPGELDDVLRRATATDPAQRFATVGELIHAFRSATGTDDDRPPRTIGWSARNPYKGLEAFDEADADDFFGRDQLVEQLHEAISRSSFVAVVGPSGSGKSSAVRAGLAPRVRTHGTYVVTMIPGSNPMEQLTRALLQVAPAAHADAVRADLERTEAPLAHALDHCLPDPAAELVLIVDQFEELFTVAGDTARAEFLQAISTAVSDERARIRVVATIRADFYDRPLSDGIISGLVQANTVAVVPLKPAELERAITAPAARVGVTIEPALVAAMVADAAGAPMALPLVQYELTTLFDGRDGDTLTVAAYNRHGGLGGAVARRADEIYEHHDEAAQADLRRLFRRLVAVGDKGDVTRRRALLSELATIPPDLIEAYTDARLLTVDRDPATREPTVEIAHEALLSEWPRLRRWVDADREAVRTLRHLTTAAAAWDAKNRDPAELYRGGRLLAAEEWASANPDELNQLEQQFLTAGIQARNAEQARERRRVHRLRVLVTSLGVVALVAIVAGLVAVQQRRVADDNAAEAQRRALENRASQLVSESSLALVDGDPDLAILLALAAHDVSNDISDTPQPGVIAALHEAVQSSRLERILDAGSRRIAVSPDGRTVALDHGGERNLLATYDIDSGERLADRTVDGSIGALAYSPDGSFIAMSFCCTEAIRGEDLPAMLLLDADTLQVVRTLDGGVESWGPSWSVDGSKVLSSSWVGVRVWNTDSPTVEHTIADTDRTSIARFVPGTSTVALAASGTLDLVDLDSGTRETRREVPFEVHDLAVSPDGERAAFIDLASQVVQVVDLAGDAPPVTVPFQSPQDIAFSPDGTWLSITGNTDEVHAVSLESGEVLELRGHGTGAWAQAYTSDGALLVPMLDGGTRVWNLSPAGPRDLANLRVDGVVRPGQPLTTSLLVGLQTSADELHVELLDLATGTSRTVAEFWLEEFKWPAFSPDGALVAGYSLDDRTPTVVDVASGRAVATLRPCETPRVIDSANGWVAVQSFSCPSPSQNPRTTESRNGFVDLSTGELLVGLDGFSALDDAVIGPPGSITADVVAYHGSETLVFRRASTLELLAEWDIPADIVPLALAFSPDGSQLGLSSQARHTIVVDVTAILAGTPADDAVTIHDEMHNGPTQRVVPLGDSTVSTGDGSELRQWDTATGTLLADVSSDYGLFMQLFALPDGKTLYYPDAGGVLRRYLADPADLAALARARVQRGFTDAECMRYFPEGDCPT